MKKSIALVLTCLALVALGSCVPFSSRPMPDVRGRVDVTPGPTAPVEIIRDKNGITHITARTRNDAYFGQGYAHAQDRFFQMEFWRRIGQGRLSELFGSGVVASDVYLRTMGFALVAQQEYEMAPVWFREGLDAYSAGVNAYITDRKPGRLSFEFALLGVQGVEIEIEPWEPWQSLAWIKVMAQDIDVDMSTELLRLDAIRAVGIDMAEDFFPSYRFDSQPTILGDDELPVTTSAARPAGGLDRELAELGMAMIPEDLSSIVLAGREQVRSMALGDGPGMGSNSWVISGEHTASGKPILCNDPHLGIQMPSIWYEVSLHYQDDDGKEVDLHGFGFAGVPGIVIGHNNDIAWGMTNGYSDQQDLYMERINPENPDQYLVGTRWVDMETRLERINVSKDDPVFITVRSTRNGPIVTDHGGYVPYTGFYTEPIQLFPTDMQLSALSLKWTALEPGSTLQSMLQINEAASFDEFREDLRLWGGPAEGIVCADVAGNIGYVLPGPIAIRGKGTGALPAPGWDDEYQWQGFIPHDELPWTKNPERGFIASSNNLQASGAYPYLIINSPVAGFRARRSTEYLTDLIARGDITIDDMPQIQLDTENGPAREILPYVAGLSVQTIGAMLESGYEIMAEPPEADEIDHGIEAAEAAIRMLGEWDLRMDPESAGAAMYARFIGEVVAATFEDDFTPEFWETGNAIGRASLSQNRIAILLPEPDNQWWDNQWTPEHRETRDEILAQALSAAYLGLEEDLGDNPDKWEWGEIHGSTFRNQTLGESGISIIENMFNRGPYPTRGGLGELVANTVGLDEPDEVGVVASMRMIVDLADWSTGMFIHPTGQSGHIRSRHYDDFINEWVDGEYFVHPWTDEQIEETGGARLVLE